MEIDSFNQVILPFKARLFRLAKTMLQTREDAEDALQEVLIKLWSNREIFDEIKNLEAFAMKIMKNFCLDRLKFQKNKTMVGFDDHQAKIENFTPFTTVSFENLRDLMLKLFSTLPEQQRLIIHMRDIEHYSYAEIEQITGLNINTIRVNLSRARQTVKSNYMKIRMYEDR